MTTISTVHQPSLLDLFKPDVELDDNIIIIGAREHNLFLFEPFLKEFAECKIFALDTETFGKGGADALYFYYNYIRSIQIGLESGKVLIIDLGGWQEQDNWQYIRENENVQTALCILSEKCFANEVAVIGQNLVFDFTNLRHHFGIICRQARDLMILSQVVWAGVGAYKNGQTALCAISHSLKAIAARLGYGDAVDKTEQASAWGWPLSNSQLNYAANDVRILFPLFAELRKLVHQLNLNYTARAESRAVAVFANMEYLGFPVRTDKAKELFEKEKVELEEAIAKFEEYFPNVPYTSQPQLLEALQSIVPDLADVQKDSLKAIDHPATQAVVAAREAKKVMDECESLINYQFYGSIHSKFNQIGPAATGRSTSKGHITARSNGRRHKIFIGINLQNASKKVRTLFGFDDASEMCLGIYDGSGMHQRIATELSKDPNLIAGYLDGLDMHSKLASEIAIILGEDKNVWTYEYIKANKDSGKAKKYRDVAKKAFYSCLNGSGVGKILIGLHQIGFLHAERSHAQRIYDAYYALYKVLVDFIKCKHKESSELSTTFDFEDAKFRSMNMHNRQYGLLRTLTGRIQYIEMEDSRYGGPQTNYTKAVAANWLLAEGNMLKMWMAEVQDGFWENPEWKANIINMVHDEINLVCLDTYRKEVAEFIVKKMDEVFGTFIRVIPALEDKMIENNECGLCKNWSEK